MGSSKQQTTQNANYANTNSIDPVYNALNMENYGNLQNWAANYQPVAIPTPLAYNADQLNAQDIIRNLADPNASYNKQQAAAQGKLADLANYQPLQVTAPVIDPNAIGNYFKGSNATAGQATGATYNAALAKAAQIDPSLIDKVNTQMTPEILQKYMSMMDPMIQQNLLDVTNKALTQQQLMAQQPNATAAAKVGAFGGSRQGVLEANTNLAYAQAAAQADANIAQHGYDTALSAAQTDLARKLQADLANQGVQVNVATTNAGLLQQINLANQNAQNTASQTGAANQTQASIANAGLSTQASISNQQAALARAQAQYQASLANANNNLAAQQLNQQGGLQAVNLGLNASNNLFNNAQGLYNNQITNANNLGNVGGQNYALTAAQQQAAYNNAVQQANLTPYTTSVLQNYLQGMPYGTSQTGNSNSQSTTISTPSLLSQISQGVGAVGGLLGAGMGIGGLGSMMGGGGLLGGGIPSAASTIANNPSPLGLQYGYGPGSI